MNLRARLFITRDEGINWLGLLALCCWCRGGIIEAGLGADLERQ